MQQIRVERRARIYDVARTAHLERLQSSIPGDFIYRRSSYDFDEDLAREMNAQQRSRWRSMLYLARVRPQIVEINEPAYISAWPSTLLYVVVVLLLNLFTKTKIQLVSYAIENADIVNVLQSKFRSRTIAKIVASSIVSILSMATSKIAFGSAGAEQTYQALFPSIGSRTQTMVFDALPSARPGLKADRRAVVLFVGSLEGRKGIRQLLSAWEVLRSKHNDVQLRLVGKGPLEPTVRAWCEDKPETQLIIDPPRKTVLDEYRGARTVVLLSQPEATWREQIGLPIVEGLSFGCEIVASNETGLAPWLQFAEHWVVDPDASASDVAEVLMASIDHAKGPIIRAAQLPEVDGRASADQWLFSI